MNKTPYNGMSARDLEAEAKSLWASIMLQQQEAKEIQSQAKKKA